MSVYRTLTAGSHLPFSSNISLFDGSFAFANYGIINGYILYLDGTLTISGITFGASQFVSSLPVTSPNSPSGTIDAYGWNQNSGVIDSITINLYDKPATSTSRATPATFINTGIMDDPYVQSVSSDAKFINNGTVNIDEYDNIANFPMDIFGKGVINVGTIGQPQATFNPGRLSTGQTINFQNGVINIFGASREGNGLDATITNFNSNDQIYFHSLEIDKLNYVNGDLQLLLNIYDGPTEEIIGEQVIGHLHFQRPQGAVFNTDTFQLSQSDDAIIGTNNRIFHHT